MSPELYTKVEAFILTSVIAWGLVEWLKPLLASFGWTKGSSKMKAVTRFAAFLIGGIVGCILYPELGGDSWKLGAGIGMSAGALNATVIALVKKRLKKVENDNQ